MLYLITAVLYLIALLIFILAPRNLWDNFIAIMATVILFFAVLQDETFANNHFVQLVFYGFNQITNYVSPLLSAIFGIGMQVQALRIYRIEQSRLQLFIGQLLGILLIVMAFFHYYFNFFVKIEEDQTWIRIPEFIMVYFVLLFINYLVITLRLTILENEDKQDYIIILGEQGGVDGLPSPSLKERLDFAITYIDRQRFLYGHMPNIIVSGGMTRPDLPSEAEIMADYLISHGVEINYIIKEDRAMNTHQNFIYSKKILQSHHRILETVAAVFVTSSYHLYRSQLYANMEGLYQISGIGSPSPIVDRVFGLVREYIAIIFMHRKLHLGMGFLMVALGIINYVHF